MLSEAPGPLSSQSITIMGLFGQAKCYYFSHPLSSNWDSVLFSHVFLIVPESPPPLLGRGILSKVQASVYMNMEPVLSLPLIEQNINPRVWTDGKKLWVEHKMLFLPLSSSKILTYFYIKSNRDQSLRLRKS